MEHSAVLSRLRDSQAQLDQARTAPICAPPTLRAAPSPVRVFVFRTPSVSFESFGSSLDFPSDLGSSLDLSCACCRRGAIEDASCLPALPHVPHIISSLCLGPQVSMNMNPYLIDAVSRGGSSAQPIDVILVGQEL